MFISLPQHHVWDPEKALIIEAHTTLRLNIGLKVPHDPGNQRCLVFVPITGSFNDLTHLVREMTVYIQFNRATHTNVLDENLLGGVWFKYIGGEDIVKLSSYAIGGLQEFHRNAKNDNV
ncbi:hypothetical protein P168DRAFT_321784 [Aspergillus campestris IBT 28561]|uniref:Uncharacterized protein n=1 Tax=Aspergillus campestris (strain IBT 28561) TaxID=1392248 RepID=A0A2I1CSX4_ASPC2|nr:uncharacterized protein P168DRAFT_321784 [Aspergillus campestris IBT 28561]PKY00718.1 hypothetical protein P168DRAFT_321784 [Aspergillus campestris IBT 28561]